MKSKSKWLSAIVTLSVVFVLVLSLGLSTIFASAADGDAGSTVAVDPVRYYNDYDNVDEADEAARDMNESLEEEGIVLLKNDGSLPLSTSSRVSVFGIAQDAMVESDGSVAESLSNAGFRVNSALESFYESDDCDYTSYGTESPLDTRTKESVKNYSDVGVLVIGRGGPGEYAVDATGIGEEEDEAYLDGASQGWAHEVALTGGKHELELTNSEKELLSYIEQSCKKVVVMYSGAQVLEMGNLEDDANINGILWIGRPGEGGSDAIGKVLSGEVNPSGKLVDEWTRDLTNDPTFANAETTDYTYTGTITTKDEEGDESTSTGQIGLEDTDNPGLDTNYNGIDYEEDIYLGYKFYETYWKENQAGSLSIPGLSKDSNATADEWYNYNVVYPFGYGLSYTSFSYDLQSVKTNLGTDVSSEISADSFSTSAGDVKENQNVTDGKVVSMTASVKVTNTGSVAGKEVVQVYVEAPYGTETGNSNTEAGAIEKPYYTLVGFGKTSELNPGQSETVDITFNVQDFASYDYADANKDGHSGYELDLGKYTIHIMEDSSHKNIVDDKIDNDEVEDKSNAYEAYSFTINAKTANSSSNSYEAAHLDADDWSGNAVGNLFSTTDSSNTQSDYYSMYMSAASGTMTSPLDIDGTNTQSTMLTRSDGFKTMPTAPTSASVGDENAAKTVIGVLEKYDDIYANDGSYDDGYAWSHTFMDLDGWTQGAGVADKETGLYNITLDDMSGRSADDPLWVEFMNQLTWEEMCSIINDAYHFTAEITTIGKVETTDENGPNVIPKGPYLAATPTRAATWNQDLLYQSGIVAGDDSLMHGATGYYGPGVNTHRGPFGGRNAEYFSQDGIQAGYMGAAFCAGMTDRGINVYVKHFALNDVGLPSNSSDIVVNVSEQSMREIYLKPFQMCMQEGRCRACMTALNRIGAVWCGQNYALQQQLAKDEWGWTGYFITDTIGMLPNMTADGLVRTGANLPDGNFSTQTKTVGVDENGNDIKETYGYLSGEWDETYDWSAELIAANMITEDDYKTKVGTKNSDGDTITVQDILASGYTDFTVPVGAVRYTVLQPQTDKTTGQEVKDSEGNTVYEEVYGTASPTQWYCVREAAMEVLYNAANSAANYNGITAKQLETQDVDLTKGQVQQGLNATRTVTETIYGTDIDTGEVLGEMGLETSANGVSILNVDEDVLSRVTYSSVTDGELPDGMYIENGLLYGTSLVSGTFTFTVLSYVDYWIPMTSEVTLEVVQSVYIENPTGDFSNPTVGTSLGTVYLVYDEDVWDYTEWNFNYVVVDGELPDGLALNEETGRITGTPTAAGTYTFTLGVSIYSDTDYYLDLDSRGQFAIDSLWSYGWFYLEDNYDGTGEEGGAKFIDDNGNIKEAELCQWILNGGSWGGMAFGGYLLDSVKVKDPTVYTVTYTITVSDPADGSEAGASESGSGSSSGLAIAALVLAIVAIVAAAVVLVIVLLKRNNGGSSSGNSDDGDERPAVD